MYPLVPKQDIGWKNNAELFLVSNGEMAQFPKPSYERLFLSNDKFKVTLDGNYNGEQGTITCRQSFCRLLMTSISHLVGVIGNNSLSNSLIKGADNFANGSITMSLYANTASNAFDNPKITVDLLDIIVGNTLVMLDQKNPDAVRERRKHVGFAGDAVYTSQTLIYKTPTNFWLRHPVLCSLVTGLMRTATNISSVNNKSYKDYDYLTAFLSLVSREDIVAAINNNDAGLARKNFDKISGLLSTLCYNDNYKDGCTNSFPITKISLPFI